MQDSSSLLQRDLWLSSLSQWGSGIYSTLVLFVTSIFISLASTVCKFTFSFYIWEIFFPSLSFLLECCFLFFIFIFLPLCVCVAGNIGKRSLFWSGIYLFGFLWFIWACWAASLSIFDPDVCYFPFLWIIRAC